ADRNRRSGRRNRTQMLIAEGENNKRDADRADKIDKRIKDRVIIDRFDIRVAVIVGYDAKTRLGFFFGVKKLNGLRTRNIFLQKSIEPCVACTNAVKSAAGVFAE